MVLKNEEDDKKNTHYKDHKAKYEQAAVRSMTAEVKFYDLVVKKNFDDDMWHTSVGSILTQIHQAIGVIKTCQNHQMSHFIRSLAKHVLQLGQPKENKKVRLEYVLSGQETKPSSDIPSLLDYYQWTIMINKKHF
jgi:hypothetical protein